MKYHIIFNPMAQSGKSKTVLDKVCQRLEQENREYEVHQTLGRGHAMLLAEQISQFAEEIIVIGGDGTLHEVLNGIVNPKRCGLPFCLPARATIFARACISPTILTRSLPKY